MKSKALIDGGICGFHSKVVAESQDEQMVQFQVASDCDKIKTFAKCIDALGPVDAYEEIGAASESRIMKTVRENLQGCCAGCAVPVGIFKAMQVAAGLALPKDATITLVKLNEA